MNKLEGPSIISIIFTHGHNSLTPNNSFEHENIDLRVIFFSKDNSLEKTKALVDGPYY